MAKIVNYLSYTVKDFFKDREVRREVCKISKVCGGGGGGGLVSVSTTDSPTITWTGDGTPGNPLIATYVGGVINPEDFIPVTEKGAPNGVATLDGGGKIPASQLPNSVMELQGEWNASTNTPTLIDGTGNPGDVWEVTTAGTQDLGSGPITFAVGDWAVYGADNIWYKSANSNEVTSVFGRTGTVTAQSGDYTFAQIGSKPTTIAGYGITDAIVQGGNTFGAPVDIGALDGNDTRILRSGAPVITIRNSQIFGGSTISNQAGYLQIGTTVNQAGLIIYKATANAVTTALITNGSDTSTGNIVDFSSNIGGTTAIRASVTKDGSFNTTGNVTATGNILAPNLVYQGGNTFGAPMILGTDDNNNLVLKTNGTNRLHLAGASLYGGTTATSANGFITIAGTNGTSTIIAKNNSNAVSVLDIVNQHTSSTGNIIDFSSNIGGTVAVRASVAKDGSIIAPNLIYQGGNTYGVPLSIGTNDDNDIRFRRNNVEVARIAAAGVFLGPGLSNITTSANAYVQVPATGTLISRNLADANPALAVAIQHTASTGNIIELRSNVSGVTATRAYVAKDGSIQSNTLAGTGDRMVIANSSGILSTQAIPVGGDNLFTANLTLAANRSHDLNGFEWSLDGAGSYVGFGGYEPIEEFEVNVTDTIRFSAVDGDFEQYMNFDPGGGDPIIIGSSDIDSGTEVILTLSPAGNLGVQSSNQVYIDAPNFYIDYLRGVGNRAVATGADGRLYATNLNQENIVSGAASLTLGAGGYYTFTGTTATYTLPAVATRTGVKYTIINTGSGDITVSGSANEIWDAGMNFTSITVGSGQINTLYNNGVNWIVL